MRYLTPIPKQFVDQSGIPYSDGTVSVYLSGSDELADIFVSAEGDTLCPNPCKLDSNGAWQCFVTGYAPLDYIVQDKDGNVVFSYYDILPGSGSGSGTPVSVDGTVGEIDVHESTEGGVTHFVVGLASAIKNIITTLAVGMDSVVNSLGYKADKVQGATAGDLAALDANGNLTDSGSKVGDFKTKQTAVPDPSASGTGLEFISYVSQNVNGEVTASKKSVQDGTTAQKGVVKLNNAINSSSTTEAATPKAVKDAYDALNNKIVARATFLSQAEWAVQSQLPGDPAKVYYVEDGTGEDAFTVYVWNTDTNAYVEVDESSISLEGYWHDAPTTTGSGNVVTGITLGNNGVPQIVKGITALTQHQDISGKLDKNGDASNTTATFTIASSRTNISSGEKLSVIFGKIAKWFSDLKAVAFSGSYTDLSDKPTIPAAANNGVLTIKQNGTSVGTFSANQSNNTEINVTDTTYESKSEASGGTAVSLVTTGEKYTWNSKQNALPISGTVAGTYYVNIAGNAATATTADKVNIGGNWTKSDSNAPVGLRVDRAYNNGWPTAYGNIITIGGSGDSQLCLGWSGTTGGIASVYYRNRRDSATNTWSDWRTMAFTEDLGSAAYTDSSSYQSKLPTSGTVTGTYYVNIAGTAETANTLKQAFINKSSQTTKIWKKIATSETFTSYRGCSICLLYNNSGYRDELGLDSIVSVTIHAGSAGSLVDARIDTYSYRSESETQLLRIGSTNQYEVWVKVPTFDTNMYATVLNSYGDWQINTDASQTGQLTDDEFTTYKASNPSVGTYYTYNVVRARKAGVGGSGTPVHVNSSGVVTACTPADITAGNVTSSGVASSSSTQRHVWFSDGAIEEKRAYSNNLTYRSDTNTISCNISGSAAQIDGHSIVVGSLGSTAGTLYFV